MVECGDARRYHSRGQLDNLDELFSASWVNRETLLSEFLRRQHPHRAQVSVIVMTNETGHRATFERSIFHI